MYDVMMMSLHTFPIVYLHIRSDHTKVCLHNLQIHHHMRSEGGGGFLLKLDNHCW